MNTTIETIEENDGHVEPVEGEATIALGIGTIDHDGRTVDSSVLEYLDNIPRSAFEETILPQAKSVLRKSSGNGRIAANKTSLAIGYVQSGKTISMTTLACLARDNGYRVIIFLAGSKTNLVKQTTERVKAYLNEAGPEGAWQVVDTRLERGTDLNLKMNEVEDQIGNLTHDDHTLVIITMKHHGHLSHLANRFNAQKKRMNALEVGGANVLIIDDEADELSPNSQVQEAAESATHRELIRLREALPNFSFVQYTATPQALVALNLSDRLSPSEVTLLSPGKGYMGGKRFFASPDRDRFLREAVDADEDAQEAPQQLRKAFFSYLLAAAQLDLSGELKKKRGKKQPSVSFMVHPHRRKAQHERWHEWLKKEWEAWGSVFADFDANDPAMASYLSEWQPAYNDLLEHSNPTTQLKPLEELFWHVEKMRRRLKFWPVNGDNPNVKWEDYQFHVLVGGDKLNRGFTVEGLITTYLTRKGNSNADTLEQRGRFFGYKEKWLDMCRLYLTNDLRTDFTSYVRHEETLRSDLANHQGTLRDWQRRFWLSPSMRLCRESILTDPLFRGWVGAKWWAQRNHFHLEQDQHDSNAQVVDLIRQSAFQNGVKSGQHYVWETAPPDHILSRLLLNYAVAPGAEQRKFNLLITEFADRIHRNKIGQVKVVVMRFDAKETYRTTGIKKQRSGPDVPGQVNPFQGENKRTTGDNKLHSRDPETATLLVYDMTSGFPKPATRHKKGPLIALYLPEERTSENVISQPSNV